MGKRDWNYAWLSRLAKQHGGPEQLIDNLVKSGRVQMIPLVVGAFIAGSSVPKLLKYLKTKYDESIYAGELAKQEIIQGIKNYDATHPDIEAEEINHQNDSIEMSKN